MNGQPISVLVSTLAIWLASACGPSSTMTPVPHDDAPSEPSPTDPCTPSNLGQSYVGCEYWPTVTGNPVATEFGFAVVVANQGDAEANVTIEGGALAEPLAFTVPAQAAVTQTLPWVPALKLCMQAGSSCLAAPTAGGLAVAGAYHLRADRPVSAYQFNPLQYAIGALKSYTNDASLLFPTNAWGQEHYVASWQHISASPGLFTITAAHDQTSVTITATADAPAAGGSPGFEAGVAKTVVLAAGDVLEVATVSGDLTGSHITSDKPIQVIGGHYCANVPLNVGACDHHEDSVLPLTALGGDYLVVAPIVPTFGDDKAQTVRVVATADGTTLAFEPTWPGAPTAIAHAGEWIEFSRGGATRITANAKILVSQIMEGSVGDAPGDPSMAMAVPTAQFRDQYLFHAPTSFDVNVLDVIAPLDATVALDGQPLAIAPSGVAGWGLARVEALDAGPLGDGNHAITGSAPFGISVYGYGVDTSYWYPGGLDLAPIQVSKPAP